MRTTFVIPLVVVGGALIACKGKKADPAGGTAAAPGGAVAVLDAAAAPVCDLTGEYRVRFASNGAEGWWLRFKVAGSPLTAEATARSIMLRLEPGPLAVSGDVATCALTLDFKSENAGDVKVTMTVDPATGAVKGDLTRTEDLKYAQPSVPVTGYRGPNTPPKGRECIVPGIYELDFDVAHPWKNQVADDGRSCEGETISEHTLTQYLRIEWMGDQLAIDQIERTSDDTWDDDFGDETVRATGCDVDLKIAGDFVNFEGKVSFAGGAAKGVASTATLQIIQESEESEELWDCESKGLPITLALTKKK